MDISSTYFHTMSISRIQDSKDEWGGTTQEYKPVPLLQLLPCGFSQSNRNGKNTVQTESVNTISYNPKIFCYSNLDIRAGDRITILYGLRVIGEFEASEPYLYSSHQEIPIQKVSES